MSDILQPRILRLEIDEADAGKTIKQYLMRKIGFSSKQLSRFKYRRDGILLNGEKRYVNAPLQAGDILEIRLTQGGEPAEENPPCRQCSSCGADPESAAAGGIAGEAGAGSESGVMKETAGTAGSGGEAGAGDGHKAGGNGAKKEGREGYLAARDGRLQKIWVKPVDWLSVNYPLQILYEDQDILAANKPSGVVCHPSPGHFDDTLSNQVAEHLGRIGKELDVRVTGRLDKDTSGIVVFALNTETAAQLIKQRQAQMAERFSFDDLSDGISDDISEPDPRACLRLMTSAETFKLYIARVRGHFGSSLTGTVDRPLRRESRDSFRMIAADDGKEARTHYCVLSQLEDGTSLVACRIEHGRTHQIRVHMAVTGHPIVGDRMYGPEAEMAEAPEVPLMLHAYRAGFRQPFTCRKIRIEAPLPDWAEEITATESLVRRKSMGSEMHVIENEFLKVAVAPHGAELCSIYDKVKNHEVVWQADPAYWNRHAPVLFPFVGKVNEGVYRYKGQSYPMGQHGFARDMDFSLVEETSDSITFRLCDNEESRAKYPFAFELTITHRLQGRTVTVEWSVKNPSDTEPLYFSIGGHPAFNCPVDPGTKKTDYFIRFDGYEKTDAIPYVLIDQPSQGIDFEHPQSLSLDGGFMPVEETTFDNDAYIFDEGTVQKVTLCYPDKTPYVTLSAPGFPSFGVWSKPHSDAPYICLEPWIGRCDNMGFAGELPDKYGEQCAAPGSTFEAVYTIEVN